MTISRIVPLVMFSLGAAACGGGEGDIGDKPLNELSDEEYATACEDSLASLPDDALEGLRHYQCASATCADGGEQAFQECLATSEQLTCERSADDPIDDCDVATSVYSTCFEAFLEQFPEYADDTCDSPLGLALPPSELAECAPVLEACPDVFGPQPDA